MTIYSYIALKNNKDIVKGKVDAADLREALENSVLSLQKYMKKKVRGMKKKRKKM